MGEGRGGEETSTPHGSLLGQTPAHTLQQLLEMQQCTASGIAEKGPVGHSTARSAVPTLRETFLVPPPHPHSSLSLGVFTAPLAGRYLLNAVLTGHRHEKVEAVLSRSNLGVARIDSGGYEPEGLENKPVAESQPSPGALGVFSLILPLQVGDTVCIDLVMGQLAHSEEPLTIFSGALLYEDTELEQV